MLKGFVIGIVFTLAALAAAGYAVLRTGTIPAGADAGPLPFERWAAGTSLHATLVRESREVPWYKKWYVWAIVGGVVAASGAATAIYFGTRTESTPLGYVQRPMPMMPTP